MKEINLKKIISFFLIAFFAVYFFCDADLAHADQYDDFISAGQQHNIISNEHFLDINSMTASQVQDFLVSKGSWIKDYVDNSEAGRGRSAAQIIWDAAHGKYEAGGTWNGITIDENTGTVSPKVILVFLQKEQSLVSRTTYNEWAMIASMGYNCFAGVSGDYNDNNCKDIYEGFTKQVENGSWQLRYNYEAAAKDAAWWAATYPGQTRYMVGDTITAGTSRTPPDSYQVTLSNRATASCYRYTPYVFYGNYNVWNLFYNLYFPGSVASPIGTNDIGDYNLATYNSFVGLSGGKVSSCRAYLDSDLLADIGSESWGLNRNYDIGEHVFYIQYKDTEGAVLGQKRIYIKRHKLADITFDGIIDISDLAIFAENWGQSSPAERMADFNADNIVDITDLAIFADSWGK